MRKFKELRTSNLKVDGTTRLKVEQDSEDKTNYIVTATDDKLTAGLHTVTIAADTVTDLSGEKLAAYSKL